jgi:hypothetical protein
VKNAIRLFGQRARTLGHADLVVGGSGELTDKTAPRVNTEVEVGEANLVTSRRPGRKDYHLPAIDIDVPVTVVPSSTKGHGHLYIDKAVPWSKYVALLEALADAEIVERGYVEAAKAHGFTTLRLPWVHKEDQ